MDWAAVTFDPSVTPQQREGIKTILGSVYPVKWNSFTVQPDQPIEWNNTGEKPTAKMSGGKTAEIVLKPVVGNASGEPVVIKNLKYWGVPRNDGFVLATNEVEAYRQVPQGQKPFEFKGTNGFMITFDINSNDVKSAAAGG